MIETRAHKEGKSKELKMVCDRLINSLKKEHYQLKSRKSFWLMSGFYIGVIAGLMYFLYTQTQPYQAHFSALPILTVLGVSGVCLALIFARIFELQVTELSEVSSEFYADYVESARRFPDLIILVEGQSYLTIKDAHTSLQRLRCRARIEMKNDSAVGSDAAKALLDAQRAEFQAISLQDRSNAVSTQPGGA
jgi:hypothetical protein